ncbi:DUF6233 domain-containing protein [Streptomyces sennicomposti]
MQSRQESTHRKPSPGTSGRRVATAGAPHAEHDRRERMDAGDCRMSGKRVEAIDQAAVRRAPAEGVAACTRCRPDSALGFVEGQAASICGLSSSSPTGTAPDYMPKRAGARILCGWRLGGWRSARAETRDAADNAPRTTLVSG